MKKIRIVAAALVAAVALGCAGTKPGTPSPTATRPSTPATTRPTTPPATEPTAASPSPTAPRTSTPPPPPPVSVEQANAARTAQAYLDGQAFSRKGLIGQLKFEGYPVEVATAAVDSLEVDYKTEAAQAAGAYLATQGFSKSGLIAQLKFEGYTDAQARYGVSKAGL